MDEPIQKTAEQRSFELLEEWLSPRQLAEYKETGFFHVTGSHGGKYRIESKMEWYNVFPMDDTGAKLCFVPEGGLPKGDRILAQNITLENDEPYALRVANRSPESGYGYGF